MKYILVLIFLVSITSCSAIKIPTDKLTYIGKWQGSNMSLVITDDGYVSYERFENGIKKSINGPIKKFDNNNFIVGVLTAKFTFEVQVPPYQENNVWKMKIDGVDLIKIVNSTNLIIPDDKSINDLVNHSFKDFAQSISNQDFKTFYKNSAKMWQVETTPEELQNIFHKFIELKIDFNRIMKFDLIISNKPFINNDNWLIIEGYYLSKPITYFTLKYTYEHPYWKLVGFKCNIK